MRMRISISVCTYIHVHARVRRSCVNRREAKMKQEAFTPQVNTEGKHGESSMPSRKSCSKRMNVDERKTEEEAPEVADTAPEVVGRRGMGKGVAAECGHNYCNRQTCASSSTALTAVGLHTHVRSHRTSSDPAYL